MGPTVGAAKSAAVDVARSVLGLADRAVSAGLTTAAGYLLSRLDITTLVRENVDLDGLATGVINDINLQQLIRESSVAVTSEAVRGIRTQTIEADQAVSRIVDRVLFRQRVRPSTSADGDGETAPS